MRKGEILNLRWHNVDFKRQFIELLDTKSGKSRKIPLSSTLKSLLKKLKKESKSEYIFTNPTTNEPYSEIRKSFDTLCDKAKVRDFRFHDLRHTVATRMVEKRVNLLVVKDILGHADIKTTMRYAHPVPEMKLKAIEVINDY